jgi:hypothetical protein
MPKFTLIAEHTDAYGNPDGTKVNYEFYCDYLPEILDHVELFLRGTGYVENGTLDFVSHDYGQDVGDGHDGMGSTLDDYPELKADIAAAHSKYYFDTERNK